MNETFGIDGGMAGRLTLAYIVNSFEISLMSPFLWFYLFTLTLTVTRFGTAKLMAFVLKTVGTI